MSTHGLRHRDFKDQQGCRLLVYHCMPLPTSKWWCLSPKTKKASELGLRAPDICSVILFVCILVMYMFVKACWWCTTSLRLVLDKWWLMIDDDGWLVVNDGFKCWSMMFEEDCCSLSCQQLWNVDQRMPGRSKSWQDLYVYCSELGRPMEASDNSSHSNISICII